MSDLAPAGVDGSFRNLLARLSRIDVRVIDDCAMAPPSEPECCDFRGFCEDRHQVRSLILTSQLPEQIGDPTMPDGVLNRSVHKRIASRCAAIRCVRIVGTAVISDLI